MAIFNNPYPILSNSKGNFIDSAAEFNIEILKVDFKDEKYQIDLRANIENEPIISNMLDKKQIKFSVIVDAKPFYRRVFYSDKSVDIVSIEIDYKDISSELSLDLYPKLITSDYLTYKNENADGPISQYAFNLSPNQKIAEHDKITITFDRAYKLFDTGPLISIAKLPNKRRPLNGMMDIKLDEQYNIIVHVHEDTYETFIKMNQISQKTLSATVSFSVIYHALSAIKDDPDSYKDLEWAKLMDEKFGVFDKLDNVDDVLKMTDLVLESPLVQLYNFIIKNDY